MKKEKSKKSGLTALNDLLLIEEDPMELQSDNSSDVLEAVKVGKIILPESYENYMKKYPFTGTVIGIGPKVKNKFSKGDKVVFARYSKAVLDGMTGPNNLRLIMVREHDILATVDD